MHMSMFKSLLLIIAPAAFPFSHFPTLQLAGAAPLPIPTCDSFPFSFTCPLEDSNGYILMESEHAVPPEGPYSIFDCVYGIPRTEIEPYTCHYYKASGEYALGPDDSPCPRQAPACSAVSTPRFSVPEKVEKLPWIESGAYLLWMKEHHT